MSVLRALFAALFLFSPVSALAQQSDRPVLFLEQGDPFSREKIKALEREEIAPPPVEPGIDKVTFLKIEPPRSLKDRVDRLLHGLYTDIPPEFDHYGYEIRRYMAHIAGPDVLGNPPRLQEEIGNIRKAKIILEYWRRELNREIDEIETAIAADPNAPSSLLTTFKYNRGVVNAFLIECQSWIDNNEAVLQFLADNPESYAYKDPVFTFGEQEERLEFISLYKARLKAHKHITEYAPFMVMVY